ncbi:MAG: hypothetical protein D6729_01950 [Deltaproteobacteria bacterium]|nr:MAG: hypothetical protein D6729_01950 [Deltaproteobacteria bacterium]
MTIRPPRPLSLLLLLFLPAALLGARQGATTATTPPAAPPATEGEGGADGAPPLPPLPKTPPPPNPDPEYKHGSYLLTHPPLAPPFRAKKVPPHPIYVILVDALRADRLGINGYPRKLTPNIDALAADGISFNRFYANAPWTKPSTTSYLTGLYPSRHRVQPEKAKLAPVFETLPEALSQLGYVTGGVVGNGNGSGAFGLDQGFSFYVDTRDHWDGLPTAEDVFVHVKRFAAKNRRRQKHFLFTFIVDPHDPYHTPDPKDEREFLWEGHPEIVRTPRWEYAPKDGSKWNFPPGGGLSRDQRRATIAVYDAAVKYADRQIGDLIADLKKKGIYENATIIVTADHGEGFGEHGIYKHAHHFFDEVVRVPFVMKSPAIPKAYRGMSTDVLAQGVDLYPTVLYLAGGKPNAKRPGVNLFDLLAEPEKYEDRLLFSEYNTFGISRTMVLSKDYKLILQLPANEELFMKKVRRKDLLPSVVFDREFVQLYDLRTDGLEMNNLARDGDPKTIPKQTRFLLDAVRHFIATQPGDKAPQMVEKLDPETERDLRALGYIK